MLRILKDIRDNWDSRIPLYVTFIGFKMLLQGRLFLLDYYEFFKQKKMYCFDVRRIFISLVVLFFS